MSVPHLCFLFTTFSFGGMLPPQSLLYLRTDHNRHPQYSVFLTAEFKHNPLNLVT